MAKPYKNKHVWHKPRTVDRVVFIEVYERKLFENICVLTLPPITLAAIIVAALLPRNASPEALGISIAIALIGGLTSLAMLFLYRPPRVLRFYPTERIAQSYRRGFSFKPFMRWHDVSGEVTCERVQVLHQEQSAGAAVATVLLMFLGPLGLLFVFLGGGKDKRLIPAYAVQCQGADRPLAIFKSSGEAKSLIDLIERN